MHRIPVWKFRWLVASLAGALLAACSPDTQTPTSPSHTPEAPSFYTYPSAIYRNHVEFGAPYDGSSTNDLHLSKRQYYT
ncbi:MAG: hypothetical protein H0X52_09775, partial [Gemmatimonadetes bacterium]|nr:hypothetical protein [Gemmatimonadota bacterium]